MRAIARNGCASIRRLRLPPRIFGSQQIAGKILVEILEFHVYIIIIADLTRFFAKDLAKNEVLLELASF